MSVKTATFRFGRYTVAIEHLDKVLFPDAGVTKGELVEHYRNLAERILPHLAGRPLTLQRFPDGIAADGFYQKNIGDHFPDWVDRITVPKQDGQVTHVIASNAAALVYLAGQATITLHAWLSRRDRLHHPDRMIFDLDPPGDAFALVRRAGRALHDLLGELGLTAWPMTTGGRGVHVVVPLDRGADFDTVRAFARDVAMLLARRDDAFTTEVRKHQRRGRLFLDYLRNGYAQTAVVPFAVRARPNAPVAVPLAWEELDDPTLNGHRWTIRTIGQRLATLDHDPWHGIGRHGRGLGAPRRRLDRMLRAD